MYSGFHTLVLHDFHKVRKFSDRVEPEMTTWGSRLNFERWQVPQVPATGIPMLLSREENVQVQVTPEAHEYLDLSHTTSFAIDTHANSLIRDADDVYRPLPVVNGTVLSKICSQLFMPFLDCDRLQNPDTLRAMDPLTKLLLPQ